MVKTNKKAIEAIAQFARAITIAKNKWTPGDTLGWLTYYNEKQEAQTKLWERLPEAAYVEDFWRIVQNGGDWEQTILAAIDSLHKGTPCKTCGAVSVQWPTRNCHTCSDSKKAKLEATKEARKALKKRMRKKKKPKSLTTAKYKS